MAERDGGHVRIAVVGTGFAGLGMAIGLKRRGIDDFVMLERSDDVGGTWRDNTYPGCQCDVPSHLYSFSFAPNPSWSRTYSMQPEIETYLRGCAEHFRLMPHIAYRHEVLDASWDEDSRVWRVETARGVWTADVLVSGHGALSEPSVPFIDGLDRFEGTAFHSGAWDHDHDLSGKRVAVIGTGSSAIQIVPHIQPHVEQLYLFQRTPAWVLPHTDRPVTRMERELYRRFPVTQRAVRAGIYLSRELLVLGLAKNPRLIEPIRRLAQAHLRWQVKDPELRRKLMPRYSPGCKRLLLSDDFYPSLSASNVDLVTDSIRKIGRSGIVTADGCERAVDSIVFATGFRVTDNPIAGVLRGRGGRSLAGAWADDGARAYLGTTVTGFPNLFLLTGPNTGIGHTSLVVMIESQMDYILGCLRYMDEEQVTSVEVRKEVLDAFNEELQDKMQRTVWSAGGCASWYMDDEGRNSTLWPDFTWRYRRLTRRFDPVAYHLDHSRRSPVLREAVTAGP